MKNKTTIDASKKVDHFVMMCPYCSVAHFAEGCPGLPIDESAKVAYVVRQCNYCDGAHHEDRCPRVAEIEYFDTGKVKRVVFWERPVVKIG